jgi:type II secretory pathway component GspD/PulD (secretin)
LCLFLALAVCQPVAAVEDTAAVVDQAQDAVPLVDNLFYETDLRQVLVDIAAETGAVILADDTVRGTVSAELTGVTLDRALEIVLTPGGYLYERVLNGDYVVTSPDPAAPGFRRLAETRVVELDFTDGQRVLKLLPEMDRLFARAEENGNLIVIFAPRQLADEIEQRIRKLDLPAQQVMIEALVMECSAGALQQFEAAAAHEEYSFDSATGILTYVDEAEDILYRLLALAGDDQAWIKANPRVVTQEGEEASVRISISQYFEIITGRVGYEYADLEAIEAAVGLTIVPRVAREQGLITCEIAPEVGDVAGIGPNDLPIIARRTAQTTVRVRDGQVIAIGGLRQEITREIRRRVPLLSDLPLIGQLFTSKKWETTDREVHIFIVPHLLDDEGHYEGDLLFDRVGVLANSHVSLTACERWEELRNHTDR